MTLQSPATGDRFVVRIYGSLLSVPTKEYSNVAQMALLSSVPTDDVLLFAQRFLDFVGRQTYDVFGWTRYEISTAEEDSEPYNPFSFISRPVESPPPPRVSNGNLFPAQGTLQFRKVVTFGHSGKLNLRFAVQEDEASAPSGDMVLNNLAGFQTRMESALTLSEFDQYLGKQDGQTGIALAMYDMSNPLGYTRYVESLEIVGATLTKTSRAKRATAPIVP